MGKSVLFCPKLHNFEVLKLEPFATCGEWRMGKRKIPTLFVTNERHGYVDS
jgi:hypothetical protein